jgi:hypothetical protein
MNCKKNGDNDILGCFEGTSPPSSGSNSKPSKKPVRAYLCVSGLQDRNMCRRRRQNLKVKVKLSLCLTN